MTTIAEMMPTIRSNLTKEGFLLLSVELDIMFELREKLHAKKIPALHHASYQPINPLEAVKGGMAKKRQSSLCAYLT